MTTHTFREVYEQFHVKVFRYFLKRVAQHDAATELTQQLFIKLWQSRDTLSVTHTIEVQLFIMANSVWIDHLRKEITRKKYYITEADLEPTQELSHTQSVSNAIEASDSLQQAMQQLPPVRKKVFILKMIHGFTNQEIAGQLSVSVKTVEDHLWKAVRFIRTMMTTLWSLLLLLF